MKIAIITGASSGLGKVFFEKVAQRYKDMDEIWLIARREGRLKELAAQYPQRAIRVLPLDLSDTNSFQKLGDILSEQNPDVRVLINNAGYDKAGLFREMSQKDITTLINMNAMGATMISRCCLPYMHEGSYQIITGSIGSFAPLPEVRHPVRRRRQDAQARAIYASGGKGLESNNHGILQLGQHV